jgi:GWxTD domain-containing protein
MKRFAPITLAAFLAVAAASPVLAGGLSKRYKEWITTPESYFLTAQEREQWKQVKTDDQARQFIADYLSRRAPDFKKMIDERAAVADKYFSSGETRGSMTLRGKVIIVFGPPSDIENNAAGGDLSATGGGPYNPNQNVAGVGGDSRGGSGSADPLSNVGPGAAAFAGESKVHAPTQSFIYDADHAPKPIGKAFRVDLRMDSAKTQTPVNAKELDEYFETMAKASIQPAGSAPQK